jgi:spermidine/putrescine transport system permease protein
LPAWGWLLVFFVAPVALVVWYSFGYKPGLFGTHANDILSFDRYVEALSPTFATTFANTLWVGLLGTALCLVIGMPVAYWMAVKAPPNRRGLLIAAVMIPFWTNFLVRTIGWQIILSPQGWLSDALNLIGLIDGPLAILYTRTAVLIGVVYNYLPLMILPLFVAFDRVGDPLREASKDLGANRAVTFARVTMPLALPGIVAVM